VLDFQASSSLAVAFSAGGDEGRRLPNPTGIPVTLVLSIEAFMASFSFAADFLVVLELTVSDTLLGALCELLHTR
jgi:hypothetical protein